MGGNVRMFHLQKAQFYVQNMLTGKMERTFDVRWMLAVCQRLPGKRNTAERQVSSRVETGKRKEKNVNHV